jgi:hypothetical protein
MGDFDGVGHSNLAVYRPSTGQWFVGGHAGVYATFGGPSDIPVPLRNYYGQGKDVLAVFRPETGQWFVAGQGSPIGFGGINGTDVPIPLYNYDGLGHDVLATFRPSTSTWYVAGLGYGINFGGEGDIPIAGDFDGVGFSQLGVFRPSTGEWFVAGHGAAVSTFGSSGDIPVSSAYAYRALPGSTGSVSASSPSTGSTTSSAVAPTSVTPTPAKPPVGARASRPGRVVKSSNTYLHDHAIASLKGLRKRVRGSGVVKG